MMPEAGAAFLVQEAARCGVTVSHEAALRIVEYGRAVHEANRRVNLTAITHPEEMLVKHHLDSLTVGRWIGPEATGVLVDVGSGAGFPGVPLALARPGLSVILVESVLRKASFLSQTVEALGLSNVCVERERAEVLGRRDSFRERADWVVCRAIGTLAVSLELCAPLARRGGQVVVMKGPRLDEEWEDGVAMARLLGMEPLVRDELKLAGDLARVLVVARMEGPCPERFPRRPGAMGRVR